MSNTDSKSEVACLRHRIEQELEAMQRGMYGLTAGTVRHEFIRVRMECIGKYQDKLAAQVGDVEANFIVCKAYVEIMG